jgi:hypothetical protein
MLPGSNINVIIKIITSSITVPPRRIYIPRMPRVKGGADHDLAMSFHYDAEVDCKNSEHYLCIIRNMFTNSWCNFHNLNDEQTLYCTCDVCIVDLGKQS